MIFVLVDKMLRTQIVTCPAVVNWLFSSHMSQDFTKLYTWEILHATLRKMGKHVVKIAKELDETKERLAKKNKVRICRENALLWKLILSFHIL